MFLCNSNNLDKEQVMDYNYRQDSYNTPESTPRMFCDYLSCNTRLFFFYRMITLIIKATHKIIKKHCYTIEDWCDDSYYARRSVEGCGTKVHFRGMSNIDKISGPVVFIGNHMSTLETFLLPGIICPRKVASFVVKKELVESSYFGPIMRSTKPVVVGRENPMEDLKTVLNEGTDILKSGRSMIVFPQSTRTAQFQAEKFNSIGVKLARKAEVPVIPIANKTDFWGNGKVIKDFGKISRKKDVYIEFGEPLNVEGNGKETHTKVVKFIQSKLNEWKSL